MASGPLAQQHFIRFIMSWHFSIGLMVSGDAAFPVSSVRMDSWSSGDNRANASSKSSLVMGLLSFP